MSANFITSSCPTEPNQTLHRYKFGNRIWLKTCAFPVSIKKYKALPVDAGNDGRMAWSGRRHGSYVQEFYKVRYNGQGSVRYRFIILGFCNPPDRPPTHPQVADRTPMKYQNQVAARGWGDTNHRIDASKDGILFFLICASTGVLAWMILIVKTV